MASMPETGPQKKPDYGRIGEIAAVAVLGISVGVIAHTYLTEGQSDNSAAAAEPVVHHHKHAADKAAIRPEATPSASPEPTLTPSEAALPTITPAPSQSPSQPTITPSPSKTPKTPKAAKAPLIVLDPGHDGITKNSTDPVTGLGMKQYPNHPEMEEVFHVSQMVQAALKHDGYRVLMTKSSAGDSASYRQRADLAIHNHAALEVSIHDDHTQKPQNFGAVYAQFDGGYRRHGNHAPVVCSNEDVIRDSLKAAKAIAHARTVSTGYKTTLQHLNFDTRPGFDGGNLSMIDLFDCIAKPGIPAVYNEMGGLTGGSAANRLPEATLRAYASGLVNGIETAIPIKKQG
jgi:N-acetylmuramoyl-L-alanine amidase